MLKVEFNEEIYLFIYFNFSLINFKLLANDKIMILELKDGIVEIELYPDKAPNHVKRFQD